MLDQHDSIQHRDPKQCDKSDSRRNAEGHPPKIKQQDATNRRKGNCAVDNQRFLDGVESKIQQDKDEDQRYWYCNRQSLFGTVKVFKLTTIVDGVLCGYINLLIDNHLDFVDYCLEVTVPYIYADNDPPSRIVPGYFGRPFCIRNVSKFA